MNITQEYLKNRLHYDPHTGIFTWLTHPNRKLKLTRAGKINPARGYASISIDGITYEEHRLAWLYMTGEFPITGTLIDHIDQEKDNNKWSNLRLTDKVGNALNMKVNETKKSNLPKGVYRERGGFKAQTRINKIDYYIGHFKDIDLAEAAYSNFIAKYWKQHNVPE